MFFQWEWHSEEQLISAIDAQRAIQLMREFDSFSSIAAMAVQSG